MAQERQHAKAFAARVSGCLGPIRDPVSRSATVSIPVIGDVTYEDMRALADEIEAAALPKAVLAIECTRTHGEMEKFHCVTIVTGNAARAYV